jgi:beta-phosphoglucomutase-like phosphatase (HAD superfamily)
MQKIGVQAILFDWHGVFDRVRLESLVEYLFLNTSKNRLAKEEIKEILISIGLNDFTKGKIGTIKFWNILSEEFHVDSISATRDVILQVNRNEYLWNHVKSLYEYRIGLLSDCPRDKKEIVLTSLKLDDPFEFKLFSCCTHTTKENDEFFMEACTQFNLLPKDILFVDDSFKNVVKADSLGFNTFLFNWVTEAELEKKTIEFFNSLNIKI